MEPVLDAPQAGKIIETVVSGVDIAPTISRPLVPP